MPTYYLYRHIRHDLNVPFYIGIGKIKSSGARKDTFKYKRAFDRKSRNRLWNFIVQKSSFSVEILWETESREEIFNKEKEFINIYGRIDKQNGSLANFTDGGEGSFDLNTTVIERTVKKNRENGCFQKCGQFLRARNLKYGSSWKGKRRCDDYPGNKKIFVYDSEGHFINEFPSITNSAEFLGIKDIKNIYSARKRNGTCNGYRFYEEFKGNKIDKLYRYYANTAHPIVMVCPITRKVVEEFISIKDASAWIKSPQTTLIGAIQKKRVHKDFLWEYKNNTSDAVR